MPVLMRAPKRTSAVAAASEAVAEAGVELAEAEAEEVQVEVGAAAERYQREVSWAP